jgi:hypothetical protein
MLDDIRESEDNRREWIVEILKDLDGKHTGFLHRGELIRCKNCIHWAADKFFCKEFSVGTPRNGYCYMGRKE